MLLEQGDIFLTQGSSIISRGIRVLTRNRGESRTKVNHVGIVTKNGTEFSATIVEASSKVIRRKMKELTKNSNTKVAIYRHTRLNDYDRKAIVNAADSYVGAKYGYVKIVMHFLDWCLGGVYFFRRLAHMQNYPICSWLVAYAYEEALWGFGVPANAASPDDIWDWVIDPKHQWVQIHPLEAL